MGRFSEQLVEAMRPVEDHAVDELLLDPTKAFVFEADVKGGPERLNCAKTPLAKAKAYAEEQFKKAGKNLSEVIPNFDSNYKMIQKKCATALDIPRIQMPVIEPKDMDAFDKRLKGGHIDIFPPYAKGKLETPTDLTKEKGEEWITLGVKDGDPKDDVIRGKWTSAAVKTLKPTQSW
jgi:hypothetical protein